MDAPCEYHYSKSAEHILAELERVDILVRAQVARARMLYARDQEFRGLVISEQEVDELLSQPAGLPRWAVEDASLSRTQLDATLDEVRAQIDKCKAASLQRGVDLRLEKLSRFFQLDAFDIDVLLICLASEVDLRYERLYAYLHDDVIKKRPSVGLALDLLCASLEDKLLARQRFSAESPLLRNHLLYLFDDPSQQTPPLLGKYLRLDDRVAAYLLDSDELDRQILPYIELTMPSKKLEDLLLPEETKDRLAAYADSNGAESRKTIFYFEGPYGVGKQSTAEAICRLRGLRLLVVQGGQLLEINDDEFNSASSIMLREAKLQGAALYWSGFDALLTEEKHTRLLPLLKRLEDHKGLVFLSGEIAWEPSDALHRSDFLRVEFQRPDLPDRIRFWTRYLSDAPCAPDVDMTAVAGQFRLTGGQVRDAAATAGNLARWRDPGQRALTLADLYAACRLQSNRKLSTLTQKITPRYTWNDIVLPDDRQQQLREVLTAAKYRSLVYGQWGFDRKLSLGKGLNIMFSGPSGTGKTMAAEIIAGELGLDLYKIDLSMVVSKYIGETEKNLSRIFSEAETANAILFFDEADALFGKRSEVRDAHDRYANIETGYLLQRMEMHEGIVILASNFRKNMDDAFVRRMHYQVEFPFPDEIQRQRIWEGIWPDETPRHPDLDFEFMAKRFEIAGGNIKNVALGAAFMAASDGRSVTHRHLLGAIEREYQKMGRVIMGHLCSSDQVVEEMQR